MTPVRDLPSVDRVVRQVQQQLPEVPQTLIASEVRAVLADRRTAILEGKNFDDQPVEQIVEQRLAVLSTPSLRHVINASGVILHTNLGRAPLSHFDHVHRYSNLEYDLNTGKRGKRDAHTAPLLQRLLQRDAIVVNNNAAAVYLVLNELASGGEAVVSRGELIEIGDGFRIPEIMARSQATLREVGTTNRTRIEDYRDAINTNTRLIMRVHPSNFHMAGFTARPTLEELATLGRERSIPVYEDLGSGCLIDLSKQGIDEPLARDSINAGVNVISFSCDKLLGGPQSGIIAGDKELVQRIRRNPMYRAFRIDKLIVETLETTLRHLLFERWQKIPTLAMILATPTEVEERARRIQAGLCSLGASVRASETAIGGGSTPDQSLPTWVVTLKVPGASQFERKLRLGRPPVIVRIEKDEIILDMRTVADEEEDLLIKAILMQV
ncbi:MAG TPA: L-seryl-tRNA(Sec) selenium transferase [Bryobacteraceae bacterium]|nr:L-seryl-tRNA(Sec) selenium transferase [Bryobacteraceae bacterium]